MHEVAEERDSSVRSRKRNQLSSAKRVLESQAQELNEDARHLRALKQCLRVRSIKQNLITNVALKNNDRMADFSRVLVGGAPSDSKGIIP